MMPVYADDLAGDLPEGWDIKPFDELVYFQEGPGIRNWQYVEEGVPFVNIRCLVDGRLDRKAMSHVSKEEALGKYQHFLLEADDYVVSSSGTLGRIASVQPSDLPCMLNTSVIRMRPKTERLDRGYLKYFLLSEYYQAQILSFATGSAQLNYGPMHLRQMFIVSPPLSEQRAIAHILGTLDEKIELNRRMSKTLEAMALALFKSWFVDFDPVRAKAEGRDPALPKPLADLFPDSFEDSEVGEIPKRWEVRSLDEIARFLNGLALQKYPPKDGPWLPVIKIAQLRAGNTSGADRASADLEPDYIVQDGDILFSWSGSLECVFWAGGLGALNQHLFKVTSADYPRWLCYLAIHQHLDDFRHIAAGKATTMGHIQRHHLSEAKLAVPPTRLLQEMDAALGPIIESTWRRSMESRTLAALRDTVLPKLISGRLRIKDAQDPVETAK